ncbi:MAG: hypothetical protein ABJA82_07440 [Myxococcales bacterium]
MMTSRTSVVLVSCLLAVPPLANRARAGDGDEAPAYLDKATAAFALNRYAIAAENFEKAFELKPDPALLYNAAQAHRLAGNKERALALYESYLRTYGRRDKRDEIEGRINELKQAIEHDKAVATSPPVTTESVGSVKESTGKGSLPAAAPAAAGTAGTALPAVPPPVEDRSAPVLVNQPGEGPLRNDSLTKKPWFWIATGGAVVAAAVVVLLVATVGSNPATASIGRASGN